MPAGVVTPPFPATSHLPTRDPAWRFTFFVPGHPMPKGSPELKTLVINGKRYPKIRDKVEVMAWVAKAAGIARKKKQQLTAKGDRSFPYEAPVALSALFVFPRPHTQPEGPPVTAAGCYAVGDLDKLVRAVGDALGAGSFSVDNSGRKRETRAGVIKDDRLITDFGDGPYKRFVDQVDGPAEPGCYITLQHYDNKPIDLGRFV